MNWGTVGDFILYSVAPQVNSQTAASLISLFCCLQYLCECQFDDNIKFKTSVNEEEPDRMRLQPIGKDREGLMYWFQVDQDQNVRVYVEEQDDLYGATWKCVVR